MCLVLVALAAFVAGCGGGSSDESKIESTLKGSINDFATGNGMGACEAMAKPLRKFIEGIKDLPCPEAVTKLGGTLDASQKEALEDVEIREVKISGNAATAEIASGAGARAEPFRLKKIDGSWYVTVSGSELQIIH